MLSKPLLLRNSLGNWVSHLITKIWIRFNPPFYLILHGMQPQWAGFMLKGHLGLKTSCGKAWDGLGFALHGFLRLLKMLQGLNQFAFGWTIAHKLPILGKNGLLLIWAQNWVVAEYSHNRVVGPPRRAWGCEVELFEAVLNYPKCNELLQWTFQAITVSAVTQKYFFFIFFPKR